MTETQTAFAAVQREHLMTLLTAHDTPWSDGKTSKTYRIQIRLGLNWREYDFKQYNPADMAAESADPVVRIAEVNGDVVQRVTIGRHQYDVVVRH